MPGQSAGQLVKDQRERVPELAMRKFRRERMASDLRLPAGENLLAVRSHELTQRHEQESQPTGLESDLRTLNAHACTILCLKSVVPRRTRFAARFLLAGVHTDEHHRPAVAP